MPVQWSSAITVLLALVSPWAARAATPPAEAALPDVQEMTRLFDALCLRAFPDDAAIDRLAASYRARAMPPAEVRLYLHDDPGRGWSYTTAIATYAITIERPPYHACAVRRMTSSGFPTINPYLAAIDGFAVGHGGGRPVALSQRRMKTQDGADISAFAHTLTPKGATGPSDAFMLLLTNYHGRIPGSELAADVVPGTAGVEIRFVHQIPPPR